MSGIGVKDLKILHVLSYPSPNFNKSWGEYLNWVANLWNPFNAHSLEVQATPYTNSLPQQKNPMTLILTIPLLFGQPCMIQCQWLIYSNPHNVHIYISGSPRNNIFTHTLNVTLHTQRGYLANLLLLKESQVLELYSMFITKNWYLKSFSGDVFHSRS